MRILHVGKFFPPHPGGIERFAEALVVAQGKLGQQVAMLAHGAPGSSPNLEIRHRAGVRILLAPCRGQLLYAPISPSFPWLLRRAIARFKPDVLHLHLPNTSAFFALLLPSARALPWVVHWQSDIPLDAMDRRLRLAYALYRPWERALLKRARAVIASSPQYLDSSATLAEWRDKVRVIPLGLPDAATAQSPHFEWPGGGLRVLAVGRLTYYKGFEVLLRALQKVPAAVLVLVGAGDLDRPLKALAASLGIAERVQFAGQVDDSALEAAYASADLFCLPSVERTESFGMVLLEAMRAGLAVVASDVTGSGMGHVVDNGRSGLLVAPGDADALARALAALNDDPTTRHAMGAAGRERFQQQFRIEAVANATQRLYDDILRRPPNRV